MTIADFASPFSAPPAAGGSEASSSAHHAPAQEGGRRRRRRRSSRRKSAREIPCRVSSDPHERRNDQGAVSERGSAK
jgi:hypothetical protein